MGSSDMNFSKGRRGSRSSENNDSAKIYQELKFQMNGQKVAKTSTYKKVLNHILINIQSTFAEPKYVLKSIREKQKCMPVEPKRIRIKLEGADDEKVDQALEQETCDMDYKEERSAWTMEKKKFEQDMSRAYGIIYGSYCTNEMQVAIKED